MKKIKSLIGIFAFALVVLALPSVTSAQWRDRDQNRDDDYYGRNGGYNGNYGNLRGVVQRLEQRARNFESRLDRIDDRNDDRYRNGNGRWGNNNRVDSLEVLTDRFLNAARDLKDEFGRGRNLNNSRDEASRVLQIGSQIESELYRSRGNRNAQGQWRQISSDLRIIANAYGMNYGGGRNGNWRNNLPF
jgi:hypothetical protein